jgi:uncharacterized membrane protein YkoI
MKSTVVVGTVALILAASAASAAKAKHDLNVLADVKVSLTDAIRIAEQEGNGKAVDAQLEAGKAPHYAVEVLSGDGKKLTEYKLDANTGKVVKASSEPLEKMLTRVKPDDIQNAQTSLTSAIQTAEKGSGGKVINAETEGNANTLHYELKLAMADGKTEKMKIDGATGQVSAK